MSTKDLGYSAVAVAIFTVSAWIAVPIGEIPVTLQTLAVCLVAALLGTKRAVLATAAYILLGFVGVPVFAGFSGGAAKILMPTGGYILGFLPMALTVGIFSDIFLKKEGRASAWLLVGMVFGTLLCYAFGTVWFMFVAGNIQAEFFSALGLCVIPYLPFDGVKTAAAFLLALRLKKFVKA